MLPNRSSLLNLEQFSFWYEEDEQPILSELTFSIERNETILMVGASGSGKSSLALCLNGLYPNAVDGKSEGTIKLNGKRLSDFPSGVVNQQVAIVFQDPDSQFCMVTVEEELIFTLENISASKDQIDKKVNEILSLVRLNEVRKSKIHELSGGMKQKLAFACALLLEPQILILDEPTANLDPASSLEFIELIHDFKVKKEFSLIVIEHQLDDWLTIADRVVALNKRGKMWYDGSAQSFFYDHTNELISEGIWLPKVIKTALEFRESTNLSFKPISESELCEYRGIIVKEKHKETNTNGKSVIEISELSFKRNEKVVLEHLNATMHGGEMIAVVGENGAGKSTFLQLLAKLLPSSRSIRLKGKQVEEWKENELRSELGYVFQNPEHQFIADTVFDEIAYGMVVNGVDHHTVKNKVQSLLSTFDLTEEKWQNPFALSGGQKRRLSVATMLDETPSVLLFDEPTFGQDERTSANLVHVLQELKNEGACIVLVTHDMDFVDRYADRVFVLHQGTLAYNGNPTNLWSNQQQLLKHARLRLPYSERLKKLVAQMEEHNHVISY